MAGRIKELRVAVDLRNQLIHGYFTIDPFRIWTIATINLPGLYQTVQNLLDEFTSNLEIRNAPEIPKTNPSTDSMDDPLAIPDPFKPPSPFD